MLLTLLFSPDGNERSSRDIHDPRAQPLHPHGRRVRRTLHRSAVRPRRLHGSYRVSQQILSSSLAQQISSRYLAQQISSSSLAQQISSRSLAQQISIRNLAQQISSRSLAQQISSRSQAYQITSRSQANFKQISSKSRAREPF